MELDLQSLFGLLRTAVLLFLVYLHPMTHVRSRRMCLVPDVVPPLAGFRLYAI
jgi:hypothetical protein